MSQAFLIGAYGMFWDRESVEWRPGSGGGAWQLLGRLHTNQPKLRVCDFRMAQGFYILLDEHGANYVGLARGREGIGARLQAHNEDPDKSWSRFCWFSFDGVVDVGPNRKGWSVVQRRPGLEKEVTADLVLRECEALLIQVLGSSRAIRRGVRGQSEMAFQHGVKWEQLREHDFQPTGRARRVDPTGFTETRG